MEALRLTERQNALIRYIQALDKHKRHILTIICRGTEPWEVKEHVTETKIELMPRHINNSQVSLARSQLELKPAFLPRETRQWPAYLLVAYEAMRKQNPQPKVLLNIQYVKEKPSAAYRRLWNLLLANRKASPTGTGEATANGERNNG